MSYHYDDNYFRWHPGTAGVCSPEQCRVRYIRYHDPARELATGIDQRGGQIDRGKERSLAYSFPQQIYSCQID